MLHTLEARVIWLQAFIYRLDGQITTGYRPLQLSDRDVVKLTLLIIINQVKTRKEPRRILYSSRETGMSLVY